MNLNYTAFRAKTAQRLNHFEEFFRSETQSYSEARLRGIKVETYVERYTDAQKERRFRAWGFSAVSIEHFKKLEEDALLYANRIDARFANPENASLQVRFIGETAIGETYREIDRHTSFESISNLLQSERVPARLLPETVGKTGTTFIMTFNVRFFPASGIYQCEYSLRFEHDGPVISAKSGVKSDSDLNRLFGTLLSAWIMDRWQP